MDLKDLEHLLNQKVFGVKLSHLGMSCAVAMVVFSKLKTIYHRKKTEREMDKAWKLVDQRRMIEMDRAKK